MSVGNPSDYLERLWTAVKEPYCTIDPRCLTLSNATTKVRHSLGSRLTHWLQVLFMVVLIGTGYAIWSGNYGPLNIGIWDGYYVAFGLHMWAGIFIVALSLILFPFYHVFADGHRQLAELSDVSLSVDIALAFLGLREYPPNYHDGRRAWDSDERDWLVGHPAQKAFFWLITIFIGLIALTGFGMYREMAPDPAWWIQILGFPAAFVGLAVLKQLHFVLAAIIGGMVLFHGYFSVLPSNWDILRSMVTGRMRAFIITDDPDEEEST